MTPIISVIAFCCGKVIKKYGEWIQRKVVGRSRLLERLPEWFMMHTSGCTRIQSLKCGEGKQCSRHHSFSKTRHKPFLLWQMNCVWPATPGREGTKMSYFVNWRSLASMLRCLMHILVRAEPMSLVAPGRKGQTGIRTGHTHTHTCNKSILLFVYHKRPVLVPLTTNLRSNLALNC